ncbi:c-type cytochrome [Vibrio mytili]|uniref:c-type cytochrome n=1 Tax=Vibrio mytili TaxID=50718 RepID=UPI000696C3F6|nr:cytochrome c [Vibrio mytili]
MNKWIANKWVVNSLVALALLSGQAFASGDVEAGKAKSGVCVACHGADGVAVIPGYPNLKGQNEQYLLNAMKAYKNKQRAGGMAAVMQVQASILSESDMANLAAYYSSL